MRITFSDNETINDADLLVIPVDHTGKIGRRAAEIDRDTDGALSQIISSHKKFNGKTGELQDVSLAASGHIYNILLIGTGESGAFDPVKTSRLLGSKLTGRTQGKTGILADFPGLNVTESACAAAHMADSYVRASYKFDKYLTTKKLADDSSLAFCNGRASGTFAKQAPHDYEHLAAVTDGLTWARDFANEPANELYPEIYARRIRDELEPLGVKVKIIDFQEMQDLGMGAAVSVGKGSDRPPCMVVMEYDGTNGSQEKPVGLVGKGITFDSGGISIKPSANMHAMKMDMAGSAAVAGAVRALAGRKAAVKVAAIVGLAENMPSGGASRPSDVVTCMNGKTVEIINTDAEGRLVLADAMTYLQQAYDPAVLIDVATLTGAALAAVGHTYTAVFANDDSLWEKLEQAGKESGDLGWRMPLHEDFSKAVQGSVADLLNLAKGPGASTAAAFLENFVDRDAQGQARPWAHLDIAGSGIPANGVASGAGVLVIERFLADHYEAKKSQPTQKPACAAHAPKRTL